MSPAQDPKPRRFPIDGVVVPILLLLIARDLALFDPPRELAWPLFHELLDVAKPVWLAPLLPRPAPTLFDDPVGLLLAALATGLAAAYALAALLGARPRVRATLLTAAGVGLVLLPTAWAVGLGHATGRPYGHDGGVVQLPLAIERVLAGETPYGADYSNSILGEQSHASTFWQPLGGNPIVHHHWYLPGMHLVMAPFFVLARVWFGGFDPRVVTSLAFVVAILLASRLPAGVETRLVAAAVIAVNPFIYWAQSFGTNDVLSAVPLLAAALLAQRGRNTLAAVVIGLGCAVKQLAWPFAPFLIVQLAGVASFREALSPAGLRRLLKPALITMAVFVAIVAPVAALDLHAFIADILKYQTGSPGSDQYPLGGTPGFGIANLLIYVGAVRNLSDYFPFQRFYVLLVPVGLLLLRFQFRRPGLPSAFVAGSVALLASVYFSRIPNPNYLILATVFLPLAVLLDRELPVDLAVVPLLLLALSSEAALREPLRTTWESAASGASVGLPDWLAPSPVGPRWRDPLSTGWSGLASTLAIGYLLAVVAGAGSRLRRGLVLLAALLVVALPLRVIVAANAAAGVLRAQDPWLGEVLGARETPGPGSWAQRPGVIRTPVVEAWPASWRKDPPRRLPETAATPGAFALGRVLRALHWRDPRMLTALALVIAALVASRLVAAPARSAILAMVLLCPASVASVLFGAGGAVSLALVLLALAFAMRQRDLAAGGMLGAATAHSAAALFLAPILAGRHRTRFCIAIFIGLLALGFPLILGFAGAFAELVVKTPVTPPGIGLSNVLFYRPDAPAALATLLRWAAVPVLATLAWLAGRVTTAGATPAAAAGVVTTAFLFLWPGVTGHAVAIPIVFFAIAGSAAGTHETPA